MTLNFSQSEGIKYLSHSLLAKALQGQSPLQGCVTYAHWRNSALFDRSGMCQSLSIHASEGHLTNSQSQEEGLRPSHAFDNIMSHVVTLTSDRFQL